MHILFGSQGSGSAAIEVALRRCGVAYRVVRASSWEPDSAMNELAQINPMRQIPTLVLTDGAVLTESAAILIHLGLSYPASGLLPNDSVERGQAIRGLVFIAANCYNAISISDYPERWTTGDDKAALEAVREAARRQLHKHWEIFADTFHGAPFLSGEQPGALDILATVVSRWSGARAHLAKHRPKFSELLKRVESHPSVAPVFGEHWA